MCGELQMLSKEEFEDVNNRYRYPVYQMIHGIPDSALFDPIIMDDEDTTFLEGFQDAYGGIDYD